MNICRMRPFAAALIASAAVGIGLAGCGGGDESDNANLVRATQYGQIEGVANADAKTTAWLGVPFAKPPTGKLRWQPPQDLDAWTGVKATKDYADACPQIGGLFGPAPKG